MKGGCQQHSRPHSDCNRVVPTTRLPLGVSELVLGQHLHVWPRLQHSRRTDKHCAEWAGVCAGQAWGCWQLRLKAIYLGTKKVALYIAVQAAEQRLTALFGACSTSCRGLPCTQTKKGTHQTRGWPGK